jgi:signal transduction histidine kinase
VDGNANDESAYIIVSDYGEGIPPEILPDILKRGVSGNGGSGIGLAIANEIAQNHGGRIIVESEYGMGTKVTLVLPVYLPAYRMAEL